MKKEVFKMINRKIMRAGALGVGLVFATVTAGAPIGSLSVASAMEPDAVTVASDTSTAMDAIALTSGVTTLLSTYLLETDIVSLDSVEDNTADNTDIDNSDIDIEEIEQDVPTANEMTASDPNENTAIEEVAEEEPEDSIKGTLAAANVDDYVNVRSGAGEEYEIVGKLYKGSIAKLLKEKDGWYKIKSGNCKGYIKSEYLSLDEDDVAAAGTRVAVVHADKLRVRKEPSKSAKIKCLVPDGEELIVLDESDAEWIEVDLEGGSGFVSAEFVELKTNYTYAETIEEEQARLERERAAKEAAQKAAEEAAAKAAEQKKTTSTASTSTTQTKSYSAPSGSNGSAVANYACQFVGNPYVYGGSSLTNGTDCSGFVMSVYAAFGVSLPHSSSSLRSSGYGVSLSDIEPGDIVCYSGHVGIYVGNDTIVHASTRSTGIKYTSPVAYRTVLAVRRIF